MSRATAKEKKKQVAAKMAGYGEKKKLLVERNGWYRPDPWTSAQKARSSREIKGLMGDFDVQWNRYEDEESDALAKDAAQQAARPQRRKYKAIIFIWILLAFSFITNIIFIKLGHRNHKEKWNWLGKNGFSARGRARICEEPEVDPRAAACTCRKTKWNGCG